MKATMIHMNRGYKHSDNVIDVKSIYITDCSNPGWFLKEDVYDHLVDNPKSIQVDISPYPNLIPVLSGDNEKNVHSELDECKRDYLLNLPRK